MLDSQVRGEVMRAIESGLRAASRDDGRGIPAGHRHQGAETGTLPRLRRIPRTTQARAWTGVQAGAAALIGARVIADASSAISNILTEKLLMAGCDRCAATTGLSR